MEVETNSTWQVCSNNNNELPSNGKYYWTFGDGLGTLETSSGSTFYDWHVAGVYPITLKSNSNSNNGKATTTLAQTTAYVRDCAQSTAVGILSMGRAIVGESITFWICDPAADLLPTTFYQWSWGDGQQGALVASQVTQQHAFLTPGPASISVRAFHNSSSGTLEPIGSWSMSLTISEAPSCPVGGIAGPTQIQAFQPVVFTMCSSTLTTDNQLTWNFGDGSAPVTSKKITMAHTFQKAGSFTVTATFQLQTWVLHHVSVSDCSSHPLQDTNAIVVIGSPTVNSPLTFTLCESYSVNALPQERTFQWFFGDQSQTTSHSSLSVFTHQYLQAGQYTARVMITSIYSNSTPPTVENATTTVQITLDSPECPEKVFPNASIVARTSPVAFSICGTSSLGANPYWVFGDGTSSKNPVHSYSKGGLYEPFVTTNISAAPVYFTSGVAVLECPASLEQTTIVVRGESLIYSEISFTLCVGSKDALLLNDLPDRTFQWSFGDGALSRLSATEKVMTYQYFEAGKYNVSVFVSHPPLQYSTTVNILAQPPIDQVGLNAEAIVGIVFSIISGLLFLSGFVYLGYQYFQKHTGKAFSVEKPSSDYFLMRNEEEEEEEDPDEDG